MENLPKIIFNTNKEIDNIPTEIFCENIQLLKIEHKPKYGGPNEAHVRIKIMLINYDFSIAEPHKGDLIDQQFKLISSNHTLDELEILSLYFQKNPHTDRAIINFANLAFKADQIIQDLSNKTNLID